MKLVSCLSKFGPLFTDAERDEVLTAYRAEVERGAEPVVAAKRVIGQLLAQAKADLMEVMVQIAKAQTKERQNAVEVRQRVLAGRG